MSDEVIVAPVVPVVEDKLEYQVQVSIDHQDLFARAGEVVWLKPSIAAKFGARVIKVAR